MDLALFAPPVIFIGVSMLLTHFFHDSDRHRGTCAELRAKYILTNKGPQDYLDESTAYKTKLKAIIIEDFLKFRAIRLHFGIINAIIIMSLGLLIAILLYTALHCCTRNYFGVIFPFVLLSILCFYLQRAYAEQGITTARRINELEEEKIGDKGTFEQQIEKLMEGKVPDIKEHRFYSLTKNTIWYYKKFGNTWTCISIDIVFIFLIFIPDPLLYSLFHP